MDECVFCKIIKGELPAEQVAESRNFIAFLDITPNVRGHTLVVPKQHVSSLMDLPEYLGNELVQFSQRVAQAILAATQAEGFNFAMNNGAAAGQLVFHAHAHIIPRTRGDGLYFGIGKHLPLTQEELHSIGESIRKQLH